MNLNDPVIYIPIITVILNNLFSQLLAWLKTKGDNKNQKDIENYKRRIVEQELRKQQASEIADLLCLHTKHNYEREPDINSNRYELQKKYWQLSLCLEPHLLRQVHEVFRNSSNFGLTPKETLIAARKLILEDENDPIIADELYHFDPQNPSSKRDIHKDA